MTTYDFKSMEPLKKRFVKRNITLDNIKICISKATAILFKTGTHTVKVKLTYDKDSVWNQLSIKCGRGSNINLSSTEFPIKFPNGNTIKQLKYVDLPPIYHNFYQELRWSPLKTVENIEHLDTEFDFDEG
jgi:hypothetical protein